MWFFDEGRFGLKPSLGKRWARKGSHPTAPVKHSYQSFYLFSAINPCTGDEFTLELPEVNTDMMNLYLAELGKELPEKPVLLVMDRAGWHTTKRLQLPKGMEIMHLPPYSPELNPVERLWQWLRLHVCRNRVFDTLDELEAALFKAWKNLTNHVLA